jgi:hypothetical protein
MFVIGYRRWPARVRVQRRLAPEPRKAMSRWKYLSAMEIKAKSPKAPDMHCLKSPCGAVAAPAKLNRDIARGGASDRTPWW